MNSVVILQARTNSSRLPGKVLLPINGMAVAVLAAKRAANTGREIIVATSIEESDDGLADIVRNNDLRCFRGSLENTLDRVVNALSLYEDSTIVFRLTADNVFPDGALLDEIECDFISKGVEYLCCNGEQSGLPYGMSVEVTRLSHLREAAKESTFIYDKEHVTPYIIRKFGFAFFQKYKYLKKGHFRCTIDSLDDYLGIQKVFAGVDDPVHVSSFNLVTRLEQVPYHPFLQTPTTRLVIGTAQLGNNYGIANKTGQPNINLCKDLIKTAISNGVTYLDTARAYGNSEYMIGNSLKDGWEGRVKIITKLAPLLDCPKEMSRDVLNAFVDASIFRSCSALRVQKIDVLLLHRASHLNDWDGGVWQRLQEHKASGIIGELGVSVQNPEELSILLSNSEVQYIQLPFNLLDWRWDSMIPKILSIKAIRKLTIHVRSIFLQGLLLSTDDNHWIRANVNNATLIKDWLSKQTSICQRINITDLCVNYINALPWVDGLTIGMENMEQLIENINYISLNPISKSQIDNIRKSRPKLGATTLNPIFWKKGSP